MYDFPDASGKKPENQEKDIPKVEPVAEGKLRKKTNGEKMKESFFASDLSKIKDFLLFDIFLPGTKKVMADIFHTTVDMILYGDNKSAYRGRDYHNISEGSGRIRRYRDEVRSYDRYFEDEPSSRRGSRITRSSSVYSCEAVEFSDKSPSENRWDAERVLQKLRDTIDQYGLVSVATYYEYCKVPSDNYMDNKYGWYDILSPRIVTETDGTVILYMPKPVPL